MTKPEIAKKTSTPTNPPPNTQNRAWYKMTRATATARRPCTSGRYDFFIVVKFEDGCAGGIDAGCGSSTCERYSERVCRARWMDDIPITRAQRPPDSSSDGPGGR